MQVKLHGKTALLTRPYKIKIFLLASRFGGSRSPALSKVSLCSSSTTRPLQLPSNATSNALLMLASQQTLQSVIFGCTKVSDATDVSMTSNRNGTFVKLMQARRHHTHPWTFHAVFKSNWPACASTLIQFVVRYWCCIRIIHISSWPKRCQQHL
jgi:hypothetical protein